MSAPPDLLELKKRYLAVNFIGLAMIASVFVYAVVVEVLKRTLAPFQGLAGLPADTAQTLKYVFVALALGNFLLIKIIGKALAARGAQYLALSGVITFALCEAVGLLGLVLFLLNGNPMDFYLFMLLSLFYFWLYFPKYRDWEEQFHQNLSKK
jgi:F0F1-type ATP synthase membrane subunit c/vacuolar-type H+-ATPase subunit K